MNSLPILGSLLFAVFAGCAQLEPEKPFLEGRPYRFEVRDDVVRLAVKNGQSIPMKEFIKLAQFTTGKVYRYKKKEIEQAGAGIEFIGTVHVPREEFFEFFQTMMKIRGFDCVQRPGKGLVEIKQA